MARFLVSALAPALLMLTLALEASASQQDGFYNINCGGEAYTDPSTKIIWKADPFNNNNNEGLHGINTSVNSSLKNITNVMRSLRYFPNDSSRNKKFCYPFVVSYGRTYLLRVSFLYGNYDGFNQPPKFVLIFNYDEWANVNTSASTTPIMHELTFNSTDTDLNICLAPHLNSSDTPFISTLEIRPLKSSMYTKSSSSLYQSALSIQYGLMLSRRINYGAKTNADIRYPNDHYDRIWEAYTTGPTLSINTSKVDINEKLDTAEPPAEVMATAITSKDPKGNLSFTYEGYGGVQGFRIEMHFEELQEITGSPRSFLFAFPNSSLLVKSKTYYVPNTSSKCIFIDKQLDIPLNFQLTLVPSPTSLHAPLLNAIELFHWTPQPLSSITTFPDDVDIIKAFQKYFKLVGYGQGDPCMPEGYAWTWIACNKDIPLPRIIEINLASFNLTGDIPPYINNLTNLKKIDLSNNKLSGVIPNVSRLLELESLDVHSNNLIGELPLSLISLPKLAKLDVSYNDLCGSPLFFQPLINYTRTWLEGPLLKRSIRRHEITVPRVFYNV